MRKNLAIEIAQECPNDFEWHEALFALYALQHYESMQREYAPNIFYNQIFSVLAGLRNTSRKTLLKHLDDPKCVVCNEPTKLAGSVQDHIIPKSRGGSDSLENTMVLCKKHNSSKGSKDLIEWWSGKDWPAENLPRNILCIYTRLMWVHLDYIFENSMESDLPDYIRIFIAERAVLLPTGEHRLALYGATYAAMAFLGWERTHGATDVY